MKLNNKFVPQVVHVIKKNIEQDYYYKLNCTSYNSDLMDFHLVNQYFQCLSEKKNIQNCILCNFFLKPDMTFHSCFQQQNLCDGVQSLPVRVIEKPKETGKK